ncbi:hypothetical protein DXG01_013993 [Tephrocybe rancida]|nr:hypothetical protein DXG01_013993 [Tephrocybe rancida]
MTFDIKHARFGIIPGPSWWVYLPTNRDDTIDAISLAFLNVFSDGGLPEIDLSSMCNSYSGNVFPTDDIKAYQACGKTVTISLGGPTGAAGFYSKWQAREFAETVWNLFLQGSSHTWPFGVVDLDGTTTIVEATTTTTPTYAPSLSHADFVNNDSTRRETLVYGSLSSSSVYAFTHSVLQGRWARKISPNKGVKVYIGAPAAWSASGQGHVSAATLGEIAQETGSKYPSFGGIMLWDALQTYDKP